MLHDPLVEDLEDGGEVGGVGDVFVERGALEGGRVGIGDALGEECWECGRRGGGSRCRCRSRVDVHRVRVGWGETAVGGHDLPKECYDVVLGQVAHCTHRKCDCVLSET